MKRYLPVMLAGLVSFSLALSGCQDSDHYSAAVKYGVRTDPLVTVTQLGDLGKDVDEPDRPGVLPLLRPQDVLAADNPMFPVGMKLFTDGFMRDPMLIPTASRQKLDGLLTELFGTPLDPKVGEIDEKTQQALKVDGPSLKEGSKLYRIHCVHCHGVPGDGRGPTARWISPHPRDFRQGLFKFQSVDQKTSANRPPRRSDLHYTLRQGIEGTAMPSFLLLTNDEREHLVSYVIQLSLRGKAEYDTIKNAFEYNLDKASGSFTVTESEDMAERFKAYFKLNARKWVESQNPDSAIMIPDKYNPRTVGGDEGMEWKGKSEDEIWQIKGAIALALFNNVDPTLPAAKKILEIRNDKPANANCKNCHADYGRQAKFKFDEWGTLVRPNNFTNGVFRGGRRPADIYHRIHSGINGTPMTKFSDTLKPNSIWDMVEFVQYMSYPAMRRKLGVNID